MRTFLFFVTFLTIAIAAACQKYQPVSTTDATARPSSHEGKDRETYYYSFDDQRAHYAKWYNLDHTLVCFVECDEGAKTLSELKNCSDAKGAPLDILKSISFGRTSETASEDRRRRNLLPVVLDFITEGEDKPKTRIVRLNPDTKRDKAALSAIYDEIEREIERPRAYRIQCPVPENLRATLLGSAGRAAVKKDQQDTPEGSVTDIDPQDLEDLTNEY